MSSIPSKRRLGERERRLATASGAQAEVVETDDGDVLRLRDAQGALVVEHRPSEGRTVLYAPEGDLLLKSERGSVALEGADGVHLRGRREVTIESERGVVLRAADRTGALLSELKLRERALSIFASKIEGESEELDWTAERATVGLAEADVEVGALRQVASLIETRVGRLVERAREAYRETEGLHQTRAGRLRLVAEDTLHALGRRTLLKAREDMKLKGEKIHLS